MWAAVASVALGSHATRLACCSQEHGDMARTLVILVLTVFAFVHGWVACRLHSPPCRVYRSAARMPAPAPRPASA